MRRLLTASITLTEVTGEDAQGVATTRVTEHDAAFFEPRNAHALSADGSSPVGSLFVAIAPEGYGTTWSVKPGDTIGDGTRSGRVISTYAVVNPRTQVLHHVEVTAG